MRTPLTVVTFILILVAACSKPGNAPSITLKKPSPDSMAKLVVSAPLGAPSATSEAFTAMSPDETGVDFVNVLEKQTTLDQSRLITENGMAVGDYDCDGDQDIFLCSYDGPNALYRNDGGLKFVDVTKEANAALLGEDVVGSGAIFADLSGDGLPDLYLCNRDANNQLFINKGDGTFEEEGAKRGADNALASSTATAFDPDRDGDLDLYIANYRLTAGYDDKMRQLVELAKKQKVELPPDMQDKYYVDGGGKVRFKPDPDQFLLNDGKGNFTDATEKAGLMFYGWSYQPLASDFNNDGWVDLFVTSDYETPDKLFINNKDGTFTDKASELLRKTALYGMGADVGDINNDGLMDLFEGDMLSRDYKRAKRQSGDMWQWRWEMTYAQPQPQMRNMLFVNRGNGYMTEMAQMADVAASEWTWSCRICDLNSDGLNELCTTSGYVRDAMDVDISNKVEKIVAAGNTAELEKLMLEQPVYKTLQYIFAPDGKYKYKLADNNFGISTESVAGGAAYVDLDGDGDLDVVLNRTNESAGVYRNDMPQGNQAVVALRGLGTNKFAVGARLWAHCGEEVFTQDVIVSRGFASGAETDIHFGLGENTSIERLVIRWPDGTMQEHENLAAGMKHTIQQGSPLLEWKEEQPESVFAQSPLPFVQKEAVTEAADYVAEPLLPLQQTLLGTGMAAADFNGDGNLDLYFCGPAGMNGQLYDGDGKGGFSPSDALQGMVPAEAEELAALAFDANGDGKTDLLVTCGGSENEPGTEAYLTHLLLNQGGSFNDTHLPVPRTGIGAAAASDIDGDGDLDLVLCGHVQYRAYGKTVPSFVLANNGDGTFTVATEQLAPGFGVGGNINDICFADYTGDGKLDLAVSKSWAAIEIWAGDGGKLSKHSTISKTGWWTGLGTGDLDNDGDLDLVAGNIGNNTKYHPKANAPVTMYAADFDGNGTRDLVEVKFSKDGKMLPGRGRSCSGYAIGYIPQKWPTWESFANASLEDVYGQGLAKAEKFTAEDLHSAVFINDGSGQFSATELPGQAQWAPVYGIGIADVNADGNLDAFLANNTKAPQCETGRWNMGYGQLLLGNGDGSFKDLTPAQSGAYLPFDQRGVVVADFNGDSLPDLGVSASDGTAQMLAGKAHEGTNLWVSLKGKGPNVAAVGAVAKLTLDNGTILTRVVQAGSGYLSSCSSSICFGIPAGTKAVSLSVRWNDGTSSETRDLTASPVSVSQ